MIGVVTEATAIYEKDIRRLNRYLKTLSLPDRLKEKVKEHFYNKHKIEEVYDAELEENLFRKMTEDLRREIRQKASIRVIDKSKFLRVFSEGTRKKFADAMNKKVYAPH